LVASLCCSGPLLVAALGIVSVPVAGALAARLFYSYWWAFVGSGMLLGALGLIIHFRRRGVCTLDQAARRRNEIVSAALAVLLAFALVYLVGDFVVIELLGIKMGVWGNPLHGRFR